MQELAETKVNCPYCGELIHVLLDSSVDYQEYIEDCQVCCRPIEFRVESAMGEIVQLTVAREDE